MTSYANRADRDIQVVILAGGLGTRVSHLWPGKPKSLIPVAGQPFIGHQLRLLAANGLHRVTLCIGFGAEAVQEYVGDGRRWDMEVTYSHEDSEDLAGTGGALVRALPLLNGHFLVIYGDAYLPVDYKAAIGAFLSQPLPAMMCVFRNRNRWDRSNAEVREGKVVRYSKQGTADQFEFIDYGMNFFRRSVIESYRNCPQPFDLALIQSDLARQGKLAAYEVFTRFYEIGSPEGVEQLEWYLSDRRTEE